MNPSIAEQLSALAVPVADLNPDPANARKHNTKNLEAIKASLATFGQRKPIVVQRKGMIVRAGNGTLAAAKALGWSHLAAVVIDDDNATASQFAIADNRTAELAEWDSETLATLLDGMDQQTRDLLAFDSEDMSTLLDSLTPESVDIVEDEVPEPPKVPVTQPGDLWVLGEHRLLCGDSRSAESYDRIMQEGAVAALVFTDPPYGISYLSGWRAANEFGRIEGDDRPDFQWAGIACARSKGWVFVWTTWKVLTQWIEGMRSAFGEMSNMVVWAKGGGGIGDLKRTFITDFEIALVFNRGAALCGERIGSVWSFGKDHASSYVHPTQKPVALAAEAIDKTTRNGDVVLDCFLGSGTTLIAAEQLGRRCFGMEISPAYCDVIVQRWENLTGQKAKRLR